MIMEKINIYLQISPSFLPKAKYVFETFFQILGIKPVFYTEFTLQDIHIYYGEQTKEKYPLKIYHNPEAVDFYNKRQLYPGSHLNLVKYGAEYIPFLFSQHGEIFHFTTQNAYLRKDIIASAFYFLTCWQEYASEKLIEPNNFFQYQSSLQYLHGFGEIPVVDRYCEILHKALLSQFSDYTSEKIWGKNTFALSFSHNIDYWHYWTEDQIKFLKNRHDTFLSPKFFQKWLRILVHSVGIQNFDPSRIMQKVLAHERSRKLDSACFLLTHDKFPDDRMNYFADEEVQAQILRNLKNCSINLQGTKEAGYQIDYLEDELGKLSGLEVEGFRVRYLNYNYQNLFNVLEKCNIEYDSSIGFYETIGFRAGISYPYYPYNMNEDRPYKVLEIPVAMTDRALYKQTEGNASRAKSKIDKMLRTASKHHTHLSLVWHNHIFDKIDYPGWSSLYWKINKFDKKNKRMVFSTNEIAKFWKKKCEK